MAMTVNSLAYRLLINGGKLSIEQGRLELKAPTGELVDSKWIQENLEQILLDIADKLSVDIFIYQSYSTGRYIKKVKDKGGLELQFNHLNSEGKAYAIFNALLDRARTTKKYKKGAPLPARQFRVTENFDFYKYWKATGLAIPPRLSSFHDYMGKLKTVIFTGTFHETKAERLIAPSLSALNISHQQLTSAFIDSLKPDNIQTTTGQEPDKSQTTNPDKEIQPHQIPQDSQSISTTGKKNYGTRPLGNADTRENIYPISTPKKPEEQSIDEWLTDYDKS